MTKQLIGVYFDPAKSTSGQRFFAGLCGALARLGADAPEREDQVLLFNISAPLRAMVAARLRGKTLVVRVDGLYFDRLSEPFLARFAWPLSTLLRTLGHWPGLRASAEHIANMLDRNWTGFARIVLAHHVVYQSRYSQRVHQTYFPHKPATIIVNGAYVVAIETPQAPNSRALRLVSIFDDWKPAKRMADIIAFVQWANEVAGVPVQLTLLGYTGRFPPCAPPGIAEFVASRPYIRTLPRFGSIEGEARDALLGGDLYVTFSFRDPCPNAVVEAMAHGLPVLAVASGGLPDIVGDAGVLLPDGDDGRFFAASRYECDFPSIDFAAALRAAQAIQADAAGYRERVRRRFETELGMTVVAARYFDVLKVLARGRGTA